MQTSPALCSIGYICRTTFRIKSKADWLTFWIRRGSPKLEDVLRDPLTRLATLLATLALQPRFLNWAIVAFATIAVATTFCFLGVVPTC